MANAIKVLNEFISAKNVEDNDFAQYRKLLTKSSFDVMTVFHKVSKRFKFTFYDNEKIHYDYLYIKDFNKNNECFMKLMKVNEKKIKKFEKKDESSIRINHTYITSVIIYYALYLLI